MTTDYEKSRADALTDPLPCPFCGGTDIFVERLDYTACFVQCNSIVNAGEACGMRGPIGIQDSDDEEMPGRGAAFREWNRRAASRVEQPAAAPIHSDDLAVDRFAVEMKSKLAAARAKGRGGWEQCSPAALSRMLREHVKKGDPRDVANFCAFLWNLRAPIVAAAPADELAAMTARAMHEENKQQ
ncbi:hypothetical protein WJ92_28030 [Burkholderia ubonensis]|uniref:Lar family restriction alleviation protein n=1 Tax=Burkholderia ubonensis TaxID=101571 RepID=UPI000753AEAB|nr:Lar family restriction alleviation protein [Burkholderia ubonensis]KVP71081.1 hypothetical protein WJ92_28030 [Burkholderia ubonensis]